MFSMRGISIHAPRKGSDIRGRNLFAGLPRFQSTPPARGATWLTSRRCATRRNFNPRPPQGERLAVIVGLTEPSTFQSTPPARGATTLAQHSAGKSIFQSTPPARGATRFLVLPLQQPAYFNPRPPQGERLVSSIDDVRLWRFQSTPPARGATFLACVNMLYLRISIHAPRKGSDQPL